MNEALAWLRYLPLVAALTLVAMAASRVGRLFAGGLGAAREAFLGALVAGVAGGIIAGAVVGGIGFGLHWPWWAIGAASLGVDALVGVLIGVLAFHRTRPPTGRITAEETDADAAHGAELEAALTEQLSRGGPLLAYAQLRLLLADHAEYRYGRAVAAELAGLVQRRAVIMDQAADDAPGSIAVRLAPAGTEVRHPEQRQLLAALGAPGDRIVLAETRSTVSDTRWDPLAEALAAEFRRRGTLTATFELLRLRRLMWRHLRRAVRNFEDRPELYRLGLPYAILFGHTGRAPDWPWPPRDDPAWVPGTLAQACILATTFPGQERPENLC